MSTQQVVIARRGARSMIIHGWEEVGATLVACCDPSISMEATSKARINHAGFDDDKQTGCLLCKEKLGLLRKGKLPPAMRPSATTEQLAECLTCGLPTRIVDLKSLHVKAGDVLTVKGRGGCKEPKLLQPLVKAVARPPAVPGSTRAIVEDAMSVKEHACKPDAMGICKTCGTDVGLSPTSEEVVADPLTKAEPERAEAYRVVRVLDPFAPVTFTTEAPLHEQDGCCDHDVPLKNECRECDKPRTAQLARIEIPAGAEVWFIHATYSQGAEQTEKMREDIRREIQRSFREGGPAVIVSGHELRLTRIKVAQ